MKKTKTSVKPDAQTSAPKKPQLASPTAPPPTGTFLREEFAARLKATEPGLSSKDNLTPVLGSFCFTGKNVFAFNDALAVQTPLNTGFKGAIRGRMLLDWLQASGAKEVSVDASKQDMLTLKAARAQVSLPVIAPDQFLFDAPTDTPRVFPITDDFQTAIKRCMPSMNGKADHPWQLGITLSWTDKGVDVFTCDNTTTAHAFVAMKSVPKDLQGMTLIVPPVFVDYLTSGKLSVEEMRIFGDWIAVQTAFSTVYGRLPQGANGQMYRDLHSDVGAGAKGAVPLPSTWWGMLTRSNVLLRGESNPVATLECVGDRIKLDTVSALGKSNDSAMLKAQLPPFKVSVVPEMLLKLPKEVERFAMVDGRKLCFYGHGFEAVASVIGD